MTEQVLNHYMAQVEKIGKIEGPRLQALILDTMAMAAAVDRVGLSTGEYIRLKLRIEKELEKVRGGLGNS